MTKRTVLHQKGLDALLTLLSSDGADSGMAYEELRNGLARYFTSRGCRDPLDLADETLTRVAAKASEFDASLNVRPSSFVYGFAHRVFLEYLRSPETRAVEFDPVIHSPMFFPGRPEGDDDAIDCLNECLSQFTTEERSMITHYFSKEKKEKIELRKRMAEEFGCSVDVLYMRVHRMRSAMKGCILDCLKRRC